MDELITRLAGDPAVREFVDEALFRADGDVERAVRLMQLRLARARPEDARVFAVVVGEAVALAAAERSPPGAHRLGERVAHLCDRSQLLLAWSAEIRALKTQALASVNWRTASRSA